MSTPGKTAEDFIPSLSIEHALHRAMKNIDQIIPTGLFTPDDIKTLREEPVLCNQGRRSFLKWGAVLTSQAILGDSAINLLTSRAARADDSFENVVEWHYSVCGYCSFGCGLQIGVNSEGTAVAVRGNGKHPTNAGRICVKGLYEHKILNNEDLRVGTRGVYPLLRGADGEWQKLTWDEATTVLAQKIRDAVYSSGPDSVATYNTGQWTLEEYYAFGKLAKGAIGTATMDSNTRLCMAAAVVGAVITLLIVAAAGQLRSLGRSR